MAEENPVVRIPSLERGGTIPPMPKELTPVQREIYCWRVAMELAIGGSSALFVSEETLATWPPELREFREDRAAKMAAMSDAELSKWPTDVQEAVWRYRRQKAAETISNDRNSQ
jgi:hypothetical protein